MSGHINGRKRKWPWAILFVLFALTFAWSLTLMREEVDGVWSIVRIGSAVASGLCLLRLVLVSVSNRRRRRAHERDGSDSAAGTDAEGHPSVDESTQERPLTYEEVFGLKLDEDGDGLPPAPEAEEWTGDDRTEVEAEGQASADQLPTEEPASTSEDDVDAPHADVDEEVDQLESLEADVASDEHLRRMREAFRARAEEAALRVKQREAELHEPASVADQER